jgi:hypothetical protein
MRILRSGVRRLEKEWDKMGLRCGCIPYCIKSSASLPLKTSVAHG